MNNFLLILTLTIIYYAVLFTWDKRKKAAFKKAQQQVIGKTTTGKINSEMTNSTFANSENMPTPILDTATVFGPNSISTKVIDDSVSGSAARNPNLSPDFENIELSNSASSSLDKVLDMDREEMLQENLEEMVMDLQAEQTLDTPKENLLGALANSKEEIIDDKALTKVIQSISNKTI